MISTKGVKEDLIWGGFSMLFSGEAPFFLRCSGLGELLIAQLADEKHAPQPGERHPRGAEAWPYGILGFFLWLGSGRPEFNGNCGHKDSHRYFFWLGSGSTEV